MEDKTIKHLEMILIIIARMASNSFLIKGWSVTIVSALFALAAKDANPRYALVSYLVVFIFWILDAYFLSQERLFRKLYDDVRVKKVSSDFSMNTDKFINQETWSSAFISKTLFIFYGLLLVTICAVMFFLNKSM